MKLNWPDGLNAQVFLDQYWQKKPLLLRQVLPDFETPVTPDELAGMSLEEGTTPRIITQTPDGSYELEHGPFQDDRYHSIGNKDWSLLVTDCEKHWPELQDWIEPFRFLPSWRMDDLMISFAPDGASVGAHIDEYDVFLLQASGTRRWQIDASKNPDVTLVENSTLRLLANFQPSDTWDLQPGDLLYLPPGVPHHGIAIGDDCTTWSIGFRAPSNLDVLDVFSEILLDNLPLVRFNDPPLQASAGAEINTDSLQRLRHLWENATALSDEELIRLSGFLLTRGGIGPEFEGEGHKPTEQPEYLRWHSFSQVAYVLDEDQAKLFINGDAYSCSKNLAIALGNSGTRIKRPQGLSPKDSKVLEKLLISGLLLNAETDHEGLDEL